MTPDTINPPLNDPFREEPEPDLSDALPCVCGDRPDWDKSSTGNFRLFCYRHDVDGPWRGDLDSAISSWNLKVIEHGDCEGDNRKAAGQQQVAENNKEWTYHALSLIASYARTGNQFTVEDIRTAAIHTSMGRTLLSAPKSPNAWGAAFSAAAKQGLIVRVGYQKNGLASAHSRVVATWKGKP
jgi:hypothetical protein